MRLDVPLLWVLLGLVTFSATLTSSPREVQLWSTEPIFSNVNQASSLLAAELELSVNQCTVLELSCNSRGRMACLSAEQKQKVRPLYKFARKIAHSEAHISFLTKCLNIDFIPKTFQLKNNIPGNTENNQIQLDKISKQAISDEKLNFEEKLIEARAEFAKLKDDLKKVFDEEKVNDELKRVEKHMNKIKTLKMKKQEEKLPGVEENETFSDSLNLAEEYSENASEAGNNGTGNKKRRRFKRKYNQPQPKKSKKRKSKPTPVAENIPQGWNGVLKNISGLPISKAEETLFLKGKKFCPTEKDPPMIRIQRELNKFYRSLRLEWIFKGQKDGRTEMEKTFYEKSNWNPPKACSEVENFISRLQEKFDRWKPPKFLKDNLSNEERRFLKSLKENDDIIYMWEDKGPSFVKMTKNQYLQAGEKELDNEKFYKEVADDKSHEIKRKSDTIVDAMVQNDEISDKVAEFLRAGKCEVAKFYHLVKTHKIPTDLDNPEQWLNENGYPLRGIVSGIGTPTERISGFVDYFLQPGMQNLGSFLKDGKHTLQIIEEINDKIDCGELTLDGVALVSLDIESMYNNMSADLGTAAAREFLENRNYQQDGNSCSVSTESILSALELCLESSFFKFNDRLYKQVGGIGTGLKLAPTYACLGMGKFERLAFSSNQRLLEKIQLWKRYIDDIFMLFKGTKEECEILVDWLNKLMPGVIKFKYEYSCSKIVFLDLEIFKEDGRLKTSIHIKPTNKQLYLDFNSNHPMHCKQSIPYSQALRVVERCSSPEDRDAELEKLKNRFEERNYPCKLIDEKFEKAKKKERRKLIFQERKNKTGDDKVRLI